MSNWLEPLKRGLGGSGYLGMVRYSTRDIIREGADIIIKQMRTVLMPRFHYEVPPQDVCVLNNEKMFEVFLAGVIAHGVRTSEWQSERFAYPAKGFNRIYQSPAWRELVAGFARNQAHPILIVDRDVYCFNGGDWHIAQLKVGLGLG